METLSLNRMNTNFYIEISGCMQKDWRETVTTWLTYVEREWSRFRNDNELSALNHCPKGEVTRVSPALYDVLTNAAFYYRKTNGLFSPYLKKEMEQHGYRSSFPFTEVTFKNKHTHTKGKPYESHPLIFLKEYKIIKNTEQEIDLGGIAKGYIVEKIARWLKKNGKTAYGIVDGGGDMTMWSNGKKSWKIGIADPFDEEEITAQFTIKNGAVATSNRLYRSWEYKDEQKHHILNGKTGEPVRTNVVQATAITTNLLEAEVLAKMCFLLPEQKRDTWIREHFPHRYFYIIKEKEEKEL